MSLISSSTADVIVIIEDSNAHALPTHNITLFYNS